MELPRPYLERGYVNVKNEEYKKKGGKIGDLQSNEKYVHDCQPVGTLTYSVRARYQISKYSEREGKRKAGGGMEGGEA